MLNRHAIVLFLGLVAVELVHPLPAASISPFGAGFLLLLVGLLLDTGQARPRTDVGHLLQGAAAVVLLGGAGFVSSSGLAAAPQALANAGIALASLGLVAEMRLPYSRLRPALALHALGDALFLVGFGWALLERTQRPGPAGWVFIGLAGAVSAYAAISNLLLQLARLRDPKSGWRYRVLEVGERALTLQTPGSKAEVAWSDVKALQRLDARHLMLVLPAPLPDALSKSGLPLEELRESAEEPVPGGPPPEAYALVLHEQELGKSASDAEQELRRRVGCIEIDPRTGWGVSSP